MPWSVFTQLNSIFSHSGMGHMEFSLRLRQSIPSNLIRSPRQQPTGIPGSILPGLCRHVLLGMTSFRHTYVQTMIARTKHGKWVIILHFIKIRNLRLDYILAERTEAGFQGRIIRIRPMFYPVRFAASLSHITLW